VAALVRHGWNAALLDSRGFGQSEGPYATFGGCEASDLRVWLDLLAERVSQSPTGPAPTFVPVLWGRSMGSQIALRAAAEDPRIRALVLESPLVDLEAAVAISLVRRLVPMPGRFARLMVRRAGKLAGVPLDRTGPLDLAARVTCPTLILHGTNDTLVPNALARRLAAAFVQHPAWVDVSDAKHTDVIDIGGEPILDEVATFLDQAVARDEAAHAEVQPAN
jgi:pimeloyl-ACP methyl ester carboxylesterase